MTSKSIQMEHGEKNPATPSTPEVERTTPHSQSNPTTALFPIDQLIAEVYNDPKQTSHVPLQLYKRVRLQHSTITLAQVKEFLSKQESAQRLRRPPTRAKITANLTAGITGPNQKAQMDLADLSALSAYNNGFKWLLLIIDVYSKYAVVLPMKNKRGETVARHLSVLLDSQTGFQPRIIQSDRGSEFIAKETRDALSNRGIIQLFSAPYSPKSQGIVESFVKTTKGLLYAYMERTGRKNWINALSDSLLNYNTREHSTTRKTPTLVHFSNTPIPSVVRVFQKKEEKAAKRRAVTLNVGDHVRVHILKHPATRQVTSAREKIQQNKKYRAQWSSRVYQVKAKKTLSGNQLYELEGLPGLFSPSALQRVPKARVQSQIEQPSGTRFEMEQHLQRLGRERAEADQHQRTQPSEREDKTDTAVKDAEEGQTDERPKSALEERKERPTRWKPKVKPGYVDYF